MEQNKEQTTVGSAEQAVEVTAADNGNSASGYGAYNPVKEILASNLVFVIMILAGVSVITTIATLFTGGTSLMETMGAAYGTVTIDGFGKTIDMIYLVVAILSIVISAVVVVALYKIHVEGGKESGLYESKGLKLLKNALILQWIITTVTTILTAVAMNYMTKHMLTAESLGIDEETMTAVSGITSAISIASTVVVYIFMALYYWKAITSTTCVSEVLATGTTNRKVSMLLIVFSFLMGASSIFSVFTADVLTILTSICTAVLYILLGVCLVKIRGALQEMHM